MVNSASKIRLTLLDDHELVLQGITSYLSKEDSFRILATYTKSDDLVRSFKERLPDILIADYELGPDENDGVNLIRFVHSRFPSVKVIVMSTHFSAGIVSSALRAGAKGFVGKHQSQEELIRAVKMVFRGKVYVEKCMLDKISDIKGTPPVSHLNSSRNSLKVTSLVNVEKLTTREQEVVRCLISGMSVSEIAYKFSRSIKTISTQKINAMKKLGVSSDKELYKITSKDSDLLLSFNV
ncbi:MULTISPECIES: response regulator transcription factor [Vibrio harveyi group]|uniref:response regulator transcription factor n=1 Tax=Vibrio harveyi group TaxID=717610 RepID=UPI000543B669|nr:MULTISPECIES: response regulator transcription factor [Vibrio harveyi group]EHR5764567.1 response regulator transcription factor [Vibrio parahaemolyticus]EHY0932732.1 response regulator transcription factor [Vibrio parahaemolyticus]EIZ0312323.1 response regulator transcription factor [Vibrio parahaemolyticus]EJE8515948.1 response regulator transcription factor [Vibrio parahaemolyticus]EJE8774744.1 response regulator transcription factor [Vibrio parahaemolyticus]